MDEANKSRTLFGGEKTPWRAEDWTASDDRVRGGKSKSHLCCEDDRARFYGTLDIKTLGGAGFASQHTTGDREWDLSEYVGIQLNITKGDKKRYTFILKDELLQPDEKTGREQSSISYECDFELPPQSEPGESQDRSIFIPWSSLNPTYRGKLKKDAKPLKKDSIKRMSLMNRSFFGTQEGDFDLTIKSIVALDKVPDKAQVISKSSDPWQVEAAHPHNASASDRRADATMVGFTINTRLLKLDLRIHRTLALVLAAVLTVTSIYTAVYSHDASEPIFWEAAGALDALPAARR